MCGRYAFYTTLQRLIKDLDLISKINFDGTFNATVSQDLPIIVKNHVGLAKWGFIAPHLAHTEFATKPQMNARSESADYKPMFAESFAKRRCLIPANGFFEWEYKTKGKKPWYIFPENQDYMMFAGLWSKIETDNNEQIVTFTVLTRQAVKPFDQVHPRMPLILSPDDYERWMFGTVQDAKNITASLPPALDKYQVSTAVNSPANNNETVIEDIRKSMLL